MASRRHAWSDLTGPVWKPPPPPILTRWRLVAPRWRRGTGSSVRCGIPRYTANDVSGCGGLQFSFELETKSSWSFRRCLALFPSSMVTSKLVKHGARRIKQVLRLPREQCIEALGTTARWGISVRCIHHSEVKSARESRRPGWKLSCNDVAHRIFCNPSASGAISRKHPRRKERVNEGARFAPPRAIADPAAPTHVPLDRSGEMGTLFCQSFVRVAHGAFAC